MNPAKVAGGGRMPWYQKAAAAIIAFAPVAWLLHAAVHVASMFGGFPCP